MKSVLASLFFSFLVLGASTALAEFKIPVLRGPVIDEVGVLRQQDRYDIEAVVRDYNAQGKAQIQVLVIDSLQGLEIEEASIKITDAWKLGTEKKDNGILFLIAPHEKKLRIEVGQGLEGALPDVIAKRIIADTVLPLFKANNMSSGVVMGVYQIIQYVDKEYADQHLTAQPEVTPSKGLPGWAVLLILFFLLFIGRFMPGSSFGGRRGGGGFFGVGGFGGGGFGGGGGGGGWSGGGGGFSGGGASGSW
jgi:uncharacterized protein